MRSIAGKSTCARTPVNFERWRIEKPPVEKSFEASFVKWVGRLVHWDIGHVSLKPAGVGEERWANICTASGRPDHWVESILLDSVIPSDT